MQLGIKKISRISGFSIDPGLWLCLISVILLISLFESISYHPQICSKKNKRFLNSTLHFCASRARMSSVLSNGTQVKFQNASTDPPPYCKHQLTPPPYCKHPSPHAQAPSGFLRAITGVTFRIFSFVCFCCASTGRGVKTAPYHKRDACTRRGHDGFHCGFLYILYPFIGPLFLGGNTTSLPAALRLVSPPQNTNGDVAGFFRRFLARKNRRTVSGYCILNTHHLTGKAAHRQGAASSRPNPQSLHGSRHRRKPQEAFRYMKYLTPRTGTAR